MQPIAIWEEVNIFFTFPSVVSFLEGVDPIKATFIQQVLPSNDAMSRNVVIALAEAREMFTNLMKLVEV